MLVIKLNQIKSVMKVGFVVLIAGCGMVKNEYGFKNNDAVKALQQDISRIGEPIEVKSFQDIKCEPREFMEGGHLWFCRTRTEYIDLRDGLEKVSPMKIMVWVNQENPNDVQAQLDEFEN